jgi:4-methyl-5(b-hydroxyethyl)-thiazole monophosphate biosynthesis
LCVLVNSAEKFRNVLDKPSDKTVVTDGHIITSQGPGDSISFALELIEKLFGKEKAQAVGKEMLALK